MFWIRIQLKWANLFIFYVRPEVGSPWFWLIFCHPDPDLDPFHLSGSGWPKWNGSGSETLVFMFVLKLATLDSTWMLSQCMMMSNIYLEITQYYSKNFAKYYIFRNCFFSFNIFFNKFLSTFDCKLTVIPSLQCQKSLI